MTKKTFCDRCDEDYLDFIEQDGNGRKKKGFNYKQEIDTQAKNLVKTLNLKGKTLLDIGCGKGYFVEALQKYGVNALGIDLIENDVFNCDKDDIFCLPYSIADFDCITAIQFFEHIPENKIDDLVEIIKSLLKPNGILVANHITKSFRSKATEKKLGHITIKPREWWLDKFKDFKELPYFVSRRYGNPFWNRIICNFLFFHAFMTQSFHPIENHFVMELCNGVNKIMKKKLKGMLG